MDRKFPMITRVRTSKRTLTMESNSRSLPVKMVKLRMTALTNSEETLATWWESEISLIILESKLQTSTQIVKNNFHNIRGWPTITTSAHSSRLQDTVCRMCQPTCLLLTSCFLRVKFLTLALKRDTASLVDYFKFECRYHLQQL